MKRAIPWVIIVGVVVALAFLGGLLAVGTPAPRCDVHSLTGGQQPTFTTTTERCP